MKILNFVNVPMRSCRTILTVLLLAVLAMAAIPAMGAVVADDSSSASRSISYVSIEVGADWPYESLVANEISDRIQKAFPSVAVGVDYLADNNSPLTRIMFHSISDNIENADFSRSLVIFVGAEPWLEYRSVGNHDIAGPKMILCCVPDSIPSAPFDYFDNGGDLIGMNLSPVESTSVDSDGFHYPLSVISQDCDYYSNLRLIKGLYPDVKRIFFFSEGNFADSYDLKQLRLAVQDHSESLEVVPVYRNYMGDKELLDTLALCSGKGVVLMRESYSFLNGEKISSFSKPVFILSDGGASDDRVLGGVAPDRSKAVDAVVKIAVDVLNGVSEDTTFRRIVSNRCKINGTVIDDYGLADTFKDTALSSNSVHYNNPESFFRKNIFLIFILTLLLLSTIFFIAVFIVADVNRNKSRGLIAKYKKLYDYSLSIYNNMPLALAHYADKGKLIKATSSALRYFETIPELNGLESDCFSNGLVQAGMSSATASSGFEKVIHHKESATALRVIFTPVSGEYGTSRYLLLLLDATRLEKEKSRLSAMTDGFLFSMNQTGIGVLESTEDGREIFSSAAWFKILACERGIPLRDSFNALDSDGKSAVMLFLNGNPESHSSFSSTVKVVYGEDKFHWVRLELYRSVLESGIPVIMCMAKNVDREKAKAKAIQASLDAAKESGQLKSRFVANMSHEIKTPLNAIVGFTDLLTSTDDVSERQMYEHFIDENNNSLLDLIDSILNIPVLGGSPIVLNKETFDLNDIMEDISLSTSMSVDLTKIKVIFNKPYPSMSLYQDKNKLKEAISNLAGNAAKYTEKGSITLNYNLDAVGWLTITVTDTGIGIAEDDQKDIFGRFVRVKNTNAEGHGLGLSIIQQIITAMGGVVGVKSKLGQGSSFWIKIKREEKQ